MIVPGLIAAFLFKITQDQTRYQEITWKEFVNRYLARGIVEKLEVVNKQYVTVTFAPGMSPSLNSIVYFNIGSADSFERNLENVQMMMNIDPASYIPVTYKTKAQL